jgi:hypothetical protein
MPQWADRKAQSLTVRALWRFGPAAAIAVLLAVPSVHGSAHSHGPGHATVPATAGHIHRSSGTGTVRAGTVSTGPAQARPYGPPHHRAGHFIKPD